MIHSTRVPLSSIRQFSKTDAAYISQNPDLKSFYQYSPDLQGLSEAIQNRAAFPVDRKVLGEELSRQYESIGKEPLVAANIERLSEENTFTITTAHQPILAGGPLYVLYKILNVINLSNQLTALHPHNHFVPVYVIGGEDHDFEEIKNFVSQGQTISWNIESFGPVGRLKTDSLESVVNDIIGILGTNENSQTILQHLKEAYRPGRTYNEATLEWINYLFGRFGLVVVQMDNVAFKQRFRQVMKKEIEEQVSFDIVAKSQAELAALGFKSQAFVRDINLFMVEDDSRNRISKTDKGYEIVGTDLTLSLEALMAKLDEDPTRFSPNVVMRPLLQEIILPNLAYIGGGGEIAYWLERKAQFEAFGIFYPVLIRRNSLVYISQAVSKKLAKTGFELQDLVYGFDTLVQHYIQRSESDQAGFLKEKDQVSQVFDEIATRIRSIDTTLEKAVFAELAKSIQGIEHLETKMTRALKVKYEIAIKQLEFVFSLTFPNDSLQERIESFLPLITQSGIGILDDLLPEMDPLKSDFIFFGEQPDA